MRRKSKNSNMVNKNGGKRDAGKTDEKKEKKGEAHQKKNQINLMSSNEQKIPNRVEHTKQNAKDKKAKQSGETKKMKKSGESEKSYQSKAKGHHEKGQDRKSEHTMENKSKGKNYMNNVVMKEKVEPMKREVNQRERGGMCFLCFCCGSNDDNDMLNELILEDESWKKKQQEEEAKYAEAEKRQNLMEMERLRMLEEEDRMKLLHEAELEEERKKLLNLNKQNEQPKRGSFLVVKNIKPKLFPKKKPKFSFLGAASAPPPPESSACVGPPPEVKLTSVPVREGIYLIYSYENNGQLELHYSKTAIKGKGVLGYIFSNSIPDFYFVNNNMKQILLKDVSKIMQSTYVNDLKPYYECVINFMKMKTKFNGILYFLPAFDAQPPPKLDVIFFDSKQKKLFYAPIEKEIEFRGNFIFVIQKGLPIFQEEIETEKLCSYVCSFGAFQGI
ncbi:hypothetical protein, conserved [Plasmodium gonderi]|uniref:Immune mapped protein 2 N-terminal domain-containing protein n=1 Tax=Plasmodium gonderi TaxID=77519 RepID=A0A1Y1JJ56_PLAGO|nr:hypothetical protein, conserved [Plasmodium gonderi]GAW80483.1 hypothetical protein, conserved [Plasmodium gonderi]